MSSKTLHHLLPELIPPIDRRYTLRFFRHAPENWKDANNRLKAISLPKGTAKQFKLFSNVVVAMKRLADDIDPALFAEERRLHSVDAPKALDNAIVNFVRMNA